MNLITDPWIPVTRRSGRRERIAPWQLTDGMGTDPVVLVSAPRPDFNGAILELLVGLFQTEAAPGTPGEWTQWDRTPPSPEELRGVLERATAWFTLSGDGPRFMQSFESFEGRRRPISYLILDDPPEETLKRNTDHFVKRGRVSALCGACIAAALYAAQAYSPSGGRGHRTSLRGGGPVTSLAAPDPEREPDRATLWHLVWLNVLPRTRFEGQVPGRPDLENPAATYPWLAPTRTSEGGEATTPEDMSPYHVYWGMPRRLRLGEPADGRCDLCGSSGPVFTELSIRHGGMNYQGAWVHPLTPYTFAEDGTPAPFHMPRGGLGYRHWGALATGARDRSSTRRPALVVAEGLADRRRVRGRARLMAFGYDVDNAKIRGWYEYASPIYQVPEETRARLRELTGALVTAAAAVAGNLRTALRRAWGVEGSPEFALTAFWQLTEPAFFGTVEDLVERPDDEDHITGLLRRWHRILCSASEELFERWAESEDAARTDPGRVARAHLDLRQLNKKKTIRDALRLPERAKGGA